MPQQSAVTLREVSKVYGDVTALERFSTSRVCWLESHSAQTTAEDKCNP